MGHFLNVVPGPFSGIYRMGKEEGERLQIEHIEQMKLHQQADSVPYPVREGSGSNNVIK